MFGGLAFMVNGNMCCGVVKDTTNGPSTLPCLRIRAWPASRPQDGFHRQAMKGMIYIDPEDLGSDSDLKTWVERALEFALSLPAK